MSPSIYIHLLLLVLVSSLTKFCGHITPWSPVVDHARRSNNTPPKSKSQPSPSSITPTDASKGTANADFIDITSPFLIHSTIASATGSSHTMASSRHLPLSLSYVLPPNIFTHQGHCTSLIFSELLSNDAHTTSPLLPRRSRSALHMLAVLHGRSNSSGNSGQQKSGPEIKELGAHPPHELTQAAYHLSRHNCLLSRLAVLPAKTYGVPLHKIQISKLILTSSRAHLVNIDLVAANLVIAPLPSPELQNTSLSATFTVLFQPLSAVPPVPQLHLSIDQQDNLLSCLRFHH